MNNCKDCRALWPMAFAVALALLVAFPAWATLDLMAVDTAGRITGTALVFCATAAGLILYVRWCIRRNCSLQRAVRERRNALVTLER
jgi:hypothetical protein